MRAGRIVVHGCVPQPARAPATPVQPLDRARALRSPPRDGARLPPNACRALQRIDSCVTYSTARVQIVARSWVQLDPPSGFRTATPVRNPANWWYSMRGGE